MEKSIMRLNNEKARSNKKDIRGIWRIKMSSTFQKKRIDEMLQISHTTNGCGVGDC